MDYIFYIIHLRSYLNLISSPLLYSSTDSDFSDSENDLCELNDVRLFPNVSPFVAERQENLSQAYLKKLGRTKYDHHSIKTGDEHVPRPATNSMNTSNSRYKKPSLRQDHYGQNPNSRELLPTAFKSGRLLPEYPELRDSYDQFCTTMSEHSSHEELEAKRSIKDLDMLNGGIEFAKSRDPSNCCSDEILDNVYLCKRRKKTTLEKDSDGAHANYQRWSMPEFTKPWYETSDSDTESTLTDQTNMKHHFLSAHQLTEAPDKPVANSKHLNSSACYDINPTCGNGTEDEEIPAAKDLGFIKKGTVSCPGIVSAESHASLNATDIDYDSSGFCEESRVVSSCSSQCHVLTNTGSENGCYAYCHESYSEDDHAKDGCKVLETNLSICEVTVRASDSGYSGLSNGTRASPECEEPDNYDTLRSEHVDILYKPEIFETLKHPQETLETQSDGDRDKNDGISREGHLYNLQSDSNATEGKNSFYSTLPKFHLLPFPDAIITNQISEGKKEKRRAKVIEEFRFNKTSLKPRTTRNSLYPTYEV